MQRPGGLVVILALVVGVGSVRADLVQWSDERCACALSALDSPVTWTEAHSTVASVDGYSVAMIYRPEFDFAESLTGDLDYWCVPLSEVAGPWSDTRQAAGMHGPSDLWRNDLVGTGAHAIWPSAEFGGTRRIADIGQSRLVSHSRTTSGGAIDPKSDKGPTTPCCGEVEVAPEWSAALLVSLAVVAVWLLPRRRAS